MHVVPVTEVVPARSLVVTARLPERPVLHTGNPFTTVGDVDVSCDSCGWHAFGARAHVKKAWQEHYRIWHGADREVGLLLLNHPRQ